MGVAVSILAVARRRTSPFSSTRAAAHLEPTSPALTELAQLLERVAVTLAPNERLLVLKGLPMPELARLSCVHKAFHVAWRSLREQHPGRRYAPPSAADFEWVKLCSRLQRAAVFGDVAVIQSMVACGWPRGMATWVLFSTSSSTAQMCTHRTTRRCGLHPKVATQLWHNYSSSTAPACQTASQCRAQARTRKDTYR